MSGDHFSEISSQSWFSRIKGAMGGVLFGILFLLISFPLLFWNEGRAVKRYKTLKEGSGIVLSVNPENVDRKMEGKLVHLSGFADTQEILADEQFGMSTRAIKLKREVEMYQWDERSEEKTRKKIGGGTEKETTYHYEKTWSADLIDSHDFRHPEDHQNPEAMPYESETWTSPDVRIGPYLLSPSLISRINRYEPLIAEDSDQIPADIRSELKIDANGFYRGPDPGQPRVGDVRITFQQVKPLEISLVAKQVRDTFEPYRAEAGGTIELLQTGIHAAEDMFQKAQQSNRVLTWILRAAGFFIMFLGFIMIFRPLSVLADVIPVLGSIVGAGTGLVSFLLSLVLSLITIALAWLFFRPLIGITCLAVAAGALILFITKLRKGFRVHRAA